MVRRRMLLSFVLLMLIASLPTSCGSAPTPVSTDEPAITDEAPTAQASPGPAAPPSASRQRIQVALDAAKQAEGTVLARVNGQDVTWEDYEPMLRQALYTIERQNAVEWRDPAMLQRLGALQNKVLRQTVDRVLMLQLAKEQRVEISTEELETAIANERNDALTTGGYPDWPTFLERNGLTDATFEKLVYERLLLQRLVAIQEVDAREEQAQLAHIAVADEQTAEEVKAKLEAGGDFAQLAAEYSVDEETKNDGGVLGWFSRQTMRAEMADAAFSLPLGEFAGPFVTAHGHTFIQVLAREIREADARVLALRQQEAASALVEAKRAESEIEYLVEFDEPEG